MEIIKNYFSEVEIDKIYEQIMIIKNDKDRKNHVRKYYETDHITLNRIEYFVNYNKYLKDLALKLGQRFKNYTFFKDKINFKYPYSQKFYPHQDITAGWGKYGKKHKTVAIFMSDTDLSNGCIKFVTDQIFDKMLTEEFKDLDYSIISEDRYQPASVKKGDIIIFDSFIPHKSEINTSDKERICLFFSYVLDNDNNVYEEYHDDKFKNCPPDIYKKSGISYRSGNTFNKTIFDINK